MRIVVMCLFLVLISCKKENKEKKEEMDPAFISIPKNPLGDNPEKDVSDINKAVREEDFEKIKGILYQNVPEEEARDQVDHLVKEYGYNNVLLWVSAPYGDMASSITAIEGGADVNIEIGGKGTPLLGATQSGSIDLVKYLLENKADPNRRGITGNTPLSVAVSLDRYDIVDLLVSKGASFSRGGDKLNKEYSILTVPLSTGNLKMVEHLLKKGASPNGGSGLPLAFAIMTKNKNAIDLLVKNGADVNYPGKNGFRPLMTATIEGDETVLKTLLAHGADPKLKDEKGMTVFDWAKKYKSKGGEVLKKLLDEKN